MTSAILSKPLAAEVAMLFRVLSDISRVRILYALSEREYNVAQLALAVGISMSGISYHMRGLRQMRIVQFRREGKEVYYRVEDEHMIALFRQGLKHVQNG